jgi:hypothetical protein
MTQPMTKATIIAALTVAVLTAEATAQTDSRGTTTAPAQIPRIRER